MTISSGGNRYCELKTLTRAGKISDLQLQVPFIPIADRIKQCFEPTESEKDFFEKQLDGWEPVPHFYNRRKDGFWDLVEE